jgi:hypothetical protein
MRAFHLQVPVARMRPQPVTIETAAWKPEGWIAPGDIYTAAKLGCCLLASLLPARHWPVASRLLAQVHLRLRPGAAHLLDHVAPILGLDGPAIVRGAIAADYRSNIEALRELLPGGWRCEPALVGREVLDGALAQSRGAVVWASPFAGSDLVTKKALASAGYSLTHLSAPSHPFSGTRVGTLVPESDPAARSQSLPVAPRDRRPWQRAPRAAGVAAGVVRQRRGLDHGDGHWREVVDVPVSGRDARSCDGRPAHRPSKRRCAHSRIHAGG